MTLYWGAGAALLGYLVLAWVTGSFLHLDTTRFYILFAILATLGIPRRRFSSGTGRARPLPVRPARTPRRLPHKAMKRSTR